MFKLRTLVILATVLLMSSVTSFAGSVAAPLNINGGWEGATTCKGLALDGAKVKFTLPVFALITVDFEGDAAIHLSTDILRPSTPRGGGAGVGLCGVSRTQLGKTGKGVATFGSVSPFFSLVVDPDFPMQALHFKTAKVFSENNKGVSGKLVGTAITLPFLFGEQLLCTVKLERVEEGNPAIALDPNLLNECAITLL
jgi:hypothetical protein